MEKRGIHCIMDRGEAQMSQNNFQKQKSQNNLRFVKKGNGKKLYFFLMSGAIRKEKDTATAKHRR